MKTKLYGLIILVIVNFTHLNCQEWLPIGTNWKYENFDMGGVFGINKYQIIDEVEIKGKLCSAIKKSNTSCDNRPIVEYLYKEANKIYYYEESQDTFNLLYDFSLKEGDIFRIPLWESISRDVELEDSIIYKIDSISEINIGERMFKHFFIRSGFYHNESLYFNEANPNLKSAQIIENIGSLNNLFIRVEDGSCHRTHTSGLRCFSAPEYGLINFTDNEECDSLIVSITHETNKNRIKIFPTITIDQVQIETSESEVFNWYLTNLSGKIETRGVILNSKNITKRIDLSNLNSSMYILVLINDEGKKYIKKIIKN